MNVLTTRNATLLLLVGLLLTWALVLRPTALGGPASYIFVRGDSMLPTLETGDLAVLHTADDYRAGEVIAFRIPDGEPGEGALVIHRIVSGSAQHGFVMRGDNRDQLDEWRPTQDEIAGRLWLRVPAAGSAVAWLRQPGVFAPLAAGLVVFFILAGGGSKRLPRRASETNVASG